MTQTSTKTMRLTGRDAISYASAADVTLSKYADPTEDAREGLTIDQARSVAREDPSLIYVDIRVLPSSVLARWKSEDWNDDLMTASRYTYEVDGEEIELSEAESAMYSWGHCEDNLDGGCQLGQLRS